MFEDKLFTQKDLANKWQLSVKAIESYRKDGIITPCKGIPAIRFTREHIAELEGVKLERFSPLERRKLERRIEELEDENRLLKQTWLKIFSDSASIVPLIK